MNAQGADWSQWQDLNSTAQTVDFQKARRAGLCFSYIKASQATFADPDFILNWANARRWQWRGAYHFLTWDRDPGDQARYHWSLLRSDPGELPLICDFEWWQTVPSAGALIMLRAYLETLKTLTTRPLGIYTAKSFWDQYGSKDPYWKQYILWLCDISGPVEIPAPWTRWDFWQYTFKLSGPAHGAESLDLDGDQYNGTEAELRARWNLPELAGISDGLYMRVICDTLNIRSAPSKGAADIGDLHYGDIVKVENFAGTSAWIKHSRGFSCVQLDNVRYMEPV